MLDYKNMSQSMSVTVHDVMNETEYYTKFVKYFLALKNKVVWFVVCMHFPMSNVLPMV